MDFLYKLHKMKCKTQSWAYKCQANLFNDWHNYRFCVCKEFTTNIIHFCGGVKCNDVQHE